MSYHEGIKEIISFRKDIAPNTKDVLAERIKDNCTIEEIRVRFYTGQQGALKVYPFVEHKGHKMESFFTFPSTTNNYLNGDDDYFVFPVSIPCDYDDYVKVQVENTDGTYAYTCVVDMVIDYAGGKQRVGGIVHGG